MPPAVLTEEQKSALAQQYYSDMWKLHSEVKSDGEHSVPLTHTAGRETLKTGIYRKIMHMQFADAGRRNRVEKSFKAWCIQKAGINSSDLAPLLLTSISTRSPWIRDEQTILLNLMEAWANPSLVVDDHTYRYTQRVSGQQYATRLNIEANLGAHVKPLWTEEYNTLAWWGDPTSISFVGKNMARRQADVNALQAGIDSIMLSIRCAKNRDYIQGVEQKSFQIGQIPQLAGLLYLTLSNTDTGGNGPMTDTLMENNLAKINTVLGVTMNIVFLSVSSQIRVARDNEADRLGGNQVSDFYRFNEALKAKFASVGVTPSRYYDSALNDLVPLIRERDMAAGTMLGLVLHPDYIPLEARYKLNDQFGPWTWTRMFTGEDLNEVAMVADGGTLDPGPENTRIALTDME